MSIEADLSRRERLVFFASVLDVKTGYENLT